MDVMVPTTGPADEAVESPESSAVPSPPGRDTRGRFLLGNYDSVKHAMYTDRPTPPFTNLDDEIATFLAGSIADDGGEGEVPTRRRALLEYRARLHRRIRQLDETLERVGMIDRRGKLRTLWLQHLSGLVMAATGVDRLLGLGRRTKATATLATYLESARETTETAATATGAVTAVTESVTPDAVTADIDGRDS